MYCCLLPFAIVAASASAQPLEPTTRNVIAELRIEGNHFVSEQKILRVLRLNRGDPYSDRTVSEALKRLWATKEFSDVSASKETVTRGVVLTIHVAEYPRVDAVEFEGNKKIKTSDLEEKVSLKAGMFVRPALLRKDFDTIEGMYREKGYYRVKVTDQIVPKQDKKTKRQNMVLVYQIAEGEKVKIAHIDFFGNRALDSSELRGAMKSNQSGWFKNSDFKPKELEEDHQKIIQLYREHGFLDAEIVKQELHFSDDGKDLDIFITIKEGTQFLVGNVTWSGNKVFPDYRILPIVAMFPGQVFDDKKFSEIQFNLNSLYWDQGYIYNSISPEKTVRRDTIDVNFAITEGKPAHINEI